MLNFVNYKAKGERVKERCANIVSFLKMWPGIKEIKSRQSK